jgi:hypothetical protein
MEAKQRLPGGGTIPIVYQDGKIFGIFVSSFGRKVNGVYYHVVEDAGGKRECGESIEACQNRELKEELGNYLGKYNCMLLMHARKTIINVIKTVRSSYWSVAIVPASSEHILEPMTSVDTGTSHHLRVVLIEMDQEPRGGKFVVSSSGEEFLVNKRIDKIFNNWPSYRHKMIDRLISAQVFARRSSELTAALMKNENYNRLTKLIDRSPISWLFKLYYYDPIDTTLEINDGKYPIPEEAVDRIYPYADYQELISRMVILHLNGIPQPRRCTIEVMPE